MTLPGIEQAVFYPNKPLELHHEDSKRYISADFLVSSVVQLESFWVQPKMIGSLPVPNINCFKISDFTLGRRVTLVIQKPSALNHWFYCTLCSHDDILSVILGSKKAQIQGGSEWPTVNNQ